MTKDYHHGDLRAALLRAGEAELAEHGVEGFSLRRAAARTGVSHAAPAHHFGGADGLLTALAASGFARFATAMRARQEGMGSGEARLVAAGLGYVDFALAHPALFGLMFSSARPDLADPDLRRAAEGAFGILVDAVAEARGASPWGDAAGPVDVAAAWAVAHGTAHLLLGGQLRFLAGAIEADREGVVRAILDRLVPPAPAGAAEQPEEPRH